jgi:WD40 repeat protein
MGADANPSKEFVACDFSFETDSDVSYLKVSPNNQILAVGYGNSNIRLFNMQSMSMLGDIEGCCYSRCCNNTCTVDFSPDSQFLAYRWDYTVRVMDLTTMTKVKEFTNNKLGENKGTNA